MERSVLMVYRAEEKELSRILYEKMKGLMLLQPTNIEELRKCLTEDMFLKTNHQAFFHVMAFLCRLHDPIEFRKRFLWPLTDKRSEANFRVSTIDYLKYLNQKYQLNWSNIKQYLVIMPGGMKFITFLLDFIKFIISKQIKQREKFFTPSELQEMTKITINQSNIHSVLRNNMFLKETCSQYISCLHEVNGVLEEKTELIRQHLTQISTQTNLSVHLFMGETFLEKYWLSIQKLYKEKFLIKPLSVLNMEKSVEEFKYQLNDFHKKELDLTRNNYTSKKELFNKLKDNGIPESLPHIKGIIDEHEDKRHHHNAGRTNYFKNDNDDIDINFLIQLFNSIYEPLSKELSNINKKSPPSNVVVKKIDDLLEKLQQMTEQMEDFQRIICKSRNTETTDNNLTMKHEKNDSIHDRYDHHRPWHRYVIHPPSAMLNDSEDINPSIYTRLFMADVKFNSYSNNKYNKNNQTNAKADRHTQFKTDTIKYHNSSDDDSNDYDNMDRTVVNARSLLRSLEKNVNVNRTKQQDTDNNGLNDTIRTQIKREEMTPSQLKSTTVLTQVQQKSPSRLLLPSSQKTLSHLYYDIGLQKEQDITCSTTKTSRKLFDLNEGQKENAINCLKSKVINTKILTNIIPTMTTEAKANTTLSSASIISPKIKINDLTLQNENNMDDANLLNDDNNIDIFNTSDTILKDVTP